MKKKFLTKHKIAALAVVGVLSVGGVALATGESTDPLISLSYLEETVVPALEHEAISQAETAAAQAEYNLKVEMAQLKEDISGGQTNGASEFIVVTLYQGQSITLPQGSQGVLRTGTASFQDGNLVNLSVGTSATAGAGMMMNHLYLATGSATIVATEATVKIMVSGEYEIKS